MLGLAIGVACLSSSCISASNARSGPNDPVIQKAKRYNLVHVPEVVPGVQVDLQYRKGQNATGRPLYPTFMPCLLNRGTAEKLAAAQRMLRRQGYGLKILDAWRPPEAHRALWNAVRDPLYVVPPEHGLSLHCYGIAVDVTLVDLQTGREVRMPSRFDEFSERARSNYTGPDPEIRRNVELLKSAMAKAGFRGIPDEWWHYDIPGKSRVYRVTAEDLGLRLPL